MRRFYKIAIAVGVLYAAGCSKTDDAVSTQRTSIEKYLTSNRLDYTESSGVFRHTLNADRPEYGTERVIAYGDSVRFQYALYGFGSPYGTLYYTNIDTLPELKKDTVLNTKYWDFAPEGIALGRTKLINGLTYGLVGARERDQLQLFVTSDLGYGGHTVGVIPADQATVWFVSVNKVIKNE